MLSTYLANTLIQTDPYQARTHVYLQYKKVYYSVRKYEFLFLLFSLSPITKYGLVEIILRIPHKMLISVLY